MHNKHMRNVICEDYYFVLREMMEEGKFVKIHEE